MCGIAGFVLSAEQSPLPPDVVLRKMCREFAHRGPDDEGFFEQANVGLGMRRLAVIDLSGGHQPLFNEDGLVTIVFNGEIYNHHDLRAQLVSRGHSFRSHSDTETILHGYEEFGADVTRHLAGMFTFAIWDTRQQTLFVARDRLGKKPLFYTQRPEGSLYFASELKALLHIPGWRPEVDPQGLDAYLTFGYVPEGFCILKNVHKLPPGHYFTFRNGVLQQVSYWTFPQSTIDAPLDQAQLLELLREAVRSRLEADVPLGAFLSGGIDSGLVVALMAEARPGAVKTFSIGFTEDAYSELPHARRVAQLFGTDHQEFMVTPQLCDVIDKLAWHLDEPFADSSAIPTYYVSQLARQYVTVALSGDGGDELFGGYTRYRIHADRASLANRLRPVAPLLRGTARAMPPGARGRAFLYNVGLQGVRRYLDSISVFGALQKKSLYTDDFARSLDGADAQDAFLAIAAGSVAVDDMDQLPRLDSLTYLPGDILVKVDRMSMAASLEARAPLLDHRLVEYVAAHRASHRYQPGQLKAALKTVARRYLPADLVDRPKQGFAVPIDSWINRQLGPRIRETVLASTAFGAGPFQARHRERLFAEHKDGIRDHSHQIWALFMLELWHSNVFRRGATA